METHLLKNSASTNEYSTLYRGRIQHVIGIDECGRGALAGPLVTCAVWQEDRLSAIPLLKDSKALTAQQRTRVAEHLHNEHVCHAIATADIEEIEEKNILQCNVACMNRSAEKLVQYLVEQKLIQEDDKIKLLVDGNYFHSSRYDFCTVVKGDALHPVISAASILAKVFRDEYMLTVAHQMYPQYGFDKHKGYGTEAHRKAILKHGASPLHRPTFLRKILHVQESLFLL